MEYSYINYKQKKFIYAFNEDKLAYFGTGDLPALEKIFSDDRFVYVEDLQTNFIQEIKDYFEGNLKVFKTPLYLSGTEFQREVYKYLAKVPYGSLVSYTELAHMMQSPNKVRAIANALGKNKHLILLPCHRVIAKDGSLGGFSGGLDLKVILHDIESIKL